MMTDEDDAPAPDLGSCCGCDDPGALVRNIVMLSRRCAIPGHGWGCVECGLPCDGAVAVLCDSCFEEFQRDPDTLRVACQGYPATEGRILIAQLPEGHFDHDKSKHPEMEG